jgi:hypothetical protein
MRAEERKEPETW